MLSLLRDIIVLCTDSTPGHEINSSTLSRWHLEFNKILSWTTQTIHGKLFLEALRYDADNAFFSPLCVEEFDLSDKNFRPCPCGYQVSTFFYLRTLLSH